jgi:hypothetical protein
MEDADATHFCSLMIFMAAEGGEYGEQWGRSRQVIAAAKSLPGSASYCVARSTGLFTCLAYPDDVGRYGATTPSRASRGRGDSRT